MLNAPRVQVSVFHALAYDVGILGRGSSGGGSNNRSSGNSTLLRDRRTLAVVASIMAEE